MEPPEARPGSLLAALGLAFTLSLVALAAPADSIPPPAPGSAGTRAIDLSSRLFGGTLLRIGLPLPDGSFDEAEVYLSLDDGKTFPIRLTEEIPVRNSLDIIVAIPNLSAPWARVSVRAGGRLPHGRHEQEIARSSRFELAPNSDLPISLPVPDAGARPRSGDHSHLEWWFTPNGSRGLELPGEGCGNSTGLFETDTPLPAQEDDPSLRTDGRRGDESSPLPPPMSWFDGPRGAPIFLLRLQLAASPRPLRI